MGTFCLSREFSFNPRAQPFPASTASHRLPARTEPDRAHRRDSCPGYPINNAMILKSHPEFQSPQRSWDCPLGLLHVWVAASCEQFRIKVHEPCRNVLCSSGEVKKGDRELDTLDFPKQTDRLPPVIAACCHQHLALSGFKY